ncbi:Uncharacterized conserved protein, DUF1501 family [Nocardioides alpinus]|uniref:DUF1501 domain-containing protein n=1 Tax=Nocardioides alpinus TaxID=748909 RepID=A0A1I0XU71_9ACTN|nr:DUF1501 domain-containing protein [Nocardioides alpinus]PKH42860.1 DUF1501 domain-containing protein [Nocardioides alpinus]SFB04454.1 Uncharacterized conserved protein, DUF1501 family [Nocardioides alpinus]
MTTPDPTTTSSGSCGCPDYDEARTLLSRRAVLGTALAGGAMALGPGLGGSGPRAYAVTGRPATRLSSATGSVLVLLSLRGAADGLSLVVPHGDPAYYAARPRIGIPQASLLAPDAMFGLHPALAPLLPMWDAGTLAAVHATGMATPNRSHFAAMEAIEDAAPGSTERNGWLNRLLGDLPGASPLQGTAMGNQVPTSLFGSNPAFVVGRVDQAKVAGTEEDGRRLASLAHAWKGSGPMSRAVRDAISGAETFGAARDLPAGTPATAYPGTGLGKALSDVSRIVRSGVGAEVITVDQGDWDMHTDLGTVEWGEMRRNAGDLAASIAAFFADLGPAADRVTLVTLSEFGRRVKENDDYGTDHGYGNVMFVAGAGVKGGRYYGSWPGLTDSLDADVLVTTDYRSVLTEVVTRRFGVSVAQVFPGFAPSAIGVMA